MPRFVNREMMSERISDSLNRKLSLYALAAGAAGVSVLALGQPSSAEVVYTPVQQTVGRLGQYAIDLNHDGIADFTIQNTFDARTFKGEIASFIDRMRIVAAANALVLTSGFLPGSAGRLLYGTPVAAPGKWRGNSALLESTAGYSTGAYDRGRWLHAINAYLGLQFEINGETHFGWARLSVKRHLFSIQVVITGFAYETVPKKPIRAGANYRGFS